jgi:pyruvate kinase
MARTKIVCTLGPASNTTRKIKELISAGLNVARLNFSHGTYEDHGRVIKNIRRVASDLKRSILIMQDLQGPRIRVGDIGKKPRMFKSGETVVLTGGRVASDSKKLPITYKNLHKDIRVGERILLVDGLVVFVVKKVKGTDIHCEVIMGGLVGTHKGVNLPDTNVKLSSLSDKDREDLFYGVGQHVDYVAMSFVRSATDIFELRALIAKYEKKLKIKNAEPIKICVKVERREAIVNIDEIIDEADAVMVARGDLGIELPAEDVPLLQKQIIEKCLNKAKPVIVATQMLDSMIVNPRPTRAEVSDVANAVIDHSDALMLSGETAIGQYPVEAVTYMRRVIEKTEASSFDDLPLKLATEVVDPIDEALSRVGNILASSMGAKMILVISPTGVMGRIVSRYRPNLPIFVVCHSSRVERQLVMSWGVLPLLLPTAKTIDELIAGALKWLKRSRKVKSGDRIIVIAGEPVGRGDDVNLIEIKEI